MVSPPLGGRPAGGDTAGRAIDNSKRPRLTDHAISVANRRGPGDDRRYDEPWREFPRVGTVFNRAWEILAPNFALFFGVTFVVALPNLLLLLNPPGSPNLGWSAFIAIFGGLILNTIGQAVILFGAFQYLRGQPVQLGEAFQRGLARFLPILGLALLYGLGIMLGAMLLVVPGLILLVMWAVAVPSCVVEELGPVASLKRSAGLTKGHRWQIFGIMIVLLIGSGVMSQLIGFMLRPAGAVVAALAGVVWTAVWAAYWNCVLIMIYHELRVAKEGVDTEQIASVFD